MLSPICKGGDEEDQVGQVPYDEDDEEEDVSDIMCMKGAAISRERSCLRDAACTGADATKFTSRLW